ERVEQERFQADSKLELASAVLAACIERRRKLEARLAKARSTRAGFAEEIVRVRNQHDEAAQRLARLQEEKAVAVARQEVLQAQGTAGGTFVPKRPRMWEARASAGWRGAGVVGLARDLVTPRAGYEDLVAHLLAGVVVVEALEQALGLWQSMTADRQALLVTLGGEVFTPDGIVSGGPAGAVAGAMSRERELRDLDRKSGVKGKRRGV